MIDIPPIPGLGRAFRELADSTPHEVQAPGAPVPEGPRDERGQLRKYVILRREPATEPQIATAERGGYRITIEVPPGTRETGPTLDALASQLLGQVRLTIIEDPDDPCA